MQKIHSEQNIKIISKDRIDITNFSFCSGLNTVLLSTAGFYPLPLTQGLLFHICLFPLSPGSFFSIFLILKQKNTSPLLDLICPGYHCLSCSPFSLELTIVRLLFSTVPESCSSQCHPRPPPCLCSSYLSMASDREDFTPSLKLFSLGVLVSKLSWFASCLPAHTFSGFSYLPDPKQSAFGPSLCPPSLLRKHHSVPWLYSLDRMAIPKPSSPDQTFPLTSRLMPVCPTGHFHL